MRKEPQDPFDENEDVLSALQHLQAEVDDVGANLKHHPNNPVLIRRLRQLSRELERLKEKSKRQAVASLESIRRSLTELLLSQVPTSRPLEEQAVLTVGVFEPITPATLAEILVAFDTLHRELAGFPLRDLIAKIGQAERVEANSTVLS